MSRQVWSNKRTALTMPMACQCFLHSKVLSIVVSHQGLKRYWHPEVPFSCPYAFILHCFTRALPAASPVVATGHGCFHLSQPAWNPVPETAQPGAALLISPSPLLLPFSNRVAFSSFICLLGWYVIRAGVLTGNTKWFFRGVGFESRSGRWSSECYSCPFHLLCLLPWAC